MDQISQVKQRIARAKAIAVLTGAGVSADSGIPTFRGTGQESGSAQAVGQAPPDHGGRGACEDLPKANRSGPTSDVGPGRGGIGGSTSGEPHGPPHLEAGLWRNFSAEDLATPEAFARNPRLVWEWYDWRRQLIASKTPNPGHHALVELEKRFRRFTLITQNVDGFHALAGSRHMVELHGNIWKVRCTHCGQVSFNRDVPIQILPYCQPASGSASGGCGGLLRPHIVWFGEALDTRDIERSMAALQSCDIMLVIGTSGVVWPAASFAEVAKSAGAYTVEINLNPSAHSDLMDEVLLGKASVILPRLL